jgi:hypothetical protein
MDAEAAYEFILSQSQRMYDHRVVILFGNYLKINDKEFVSHFIPVKLSDLLPGMTIGREIITDKGLKLLNAGVTLTQGTIDKIITHSSSDPIVGNIYITTNK